MITMNLTGHMRHNKPAYYLQSGLIILLGVIALIAPSFAAISLNILVALVLIAGGGLYIAYTHRGRSWKQLIPAGIIVLLGVIMLFRPFSGAAALSVLLAVYFLVDGTFELVLAYEFWQVHHSYFLVFSGMLSFALFLFMVFGFPVLSVMILGIILGIKLIVFGVSSMLLIRNV